MKPTKTPKRWQMQSTGSESPICCSLVQDIYFVTFRRQNKNQNTSSEAEKTPLPRNFRKEHGHLASQRGGHFCSEPFPDGWKGGQKEHRKVPKLLVRRESTGLRGEEFCL